MASGSVFSSFCSPQVIAVVGPTASGKSALADEIAVRLGSEVVSADAMQVYRRMDIGTAKTPVDERRAPLRCIDLVEPSSAYSVALYSAVAHDAIDALVASSRVPVLCGGTGLYVRAALEDMQFPAGEQVANPIRERLTRQAQELGPEAFHALLRDVDPQSADLIHPNNVRRVIRAFELLEQHTSYAKEHETLHCRVDRYPTLHIGLDVPREVLYERINCRVDRMVELGLVDEVASLVNDGLGDTLTARQAIGYKEIISYLSGDCSLCDALEDIKRATRRYAKRQMTWFRADSRIHWVSMEKLDVAKAASEVLQLMERP